MIASVIASRRLLDAIKDPTQEGALAGLLASNRASAVHLLAAASASPSVLGAVLEGLAPGTDINARDEKRQWCALHFACEAASAENARQLLRNSADIHATCTYHGVKNTPCLMIAVVKASKPLLDVLIEFKCDVNQVDGEGKTALWLSCRYASALPLTEALIQCGARIDECRKESGSSPLHAAAYENNIEAIKILLKHGANPNIAVTQRGFTPLHIAVVKGHTDSALALSSHPKTTVNYPSNESAYDLAVDSTNEEIIQVLKEHNADKQTNAPQKKDRTLVSQFTEEEKAEFYIKEEILSTRQRAIQQLLDFHENSRIDLYLLKFDKAWRLGKLGGYFACPLVMNKDSSPYWDYNVEKCINTFESLASPVELQLHVKARGSAQQYMLHCCCCSFLDTQSPLSITHLPAVKEPEPSKPEKKDTISSLLNRITKKEKEVQLPAGPVASEESITFRECVKNEVSIMYYSNHRNVMPCVVVWGDTSHDIRQYVIHNNDLLGTCSWLREDEKGSLRRLSSVSLASMESSESDVVQTSITFLRPRYESVTLREFISKSQGISERQAFLITLQILSGLDYLHQNRTLHGNLCIDTVSIIPATSRVIIHSFKCGKRFESSSVKDLSRFVLMNSDQDLSSISLSPEWGSMEKRLQRVNEFSELFKSIRQCEVYSVSIILYSLLTANVDVDHSKMKLNGRSRTTSTLFEMLSTASPMERPWSGTAVMMVQTILFIPEDVWGFQSVEAAEKWLKHRRQEECHKISEASTEGLVELEDVLRLEFLRTMSQTGMTYLLVRSIHRLL